MKNFFVRMSFPRAVILFCSLCSLALGVLVYQRSQRLDEIQNELKHVRETVKELQSDAYRLSDLQKVANNEKFKAQSEPESYIRATGGDKDINIGQIEIKKTTKGNLRGVEDNVYKITPQTKSQRYNRVQIGNFLFKLEHDSRRVKVTRLKLTPADKVSPGEIGKDQWVFEADLTTRIKLDTTPAGPNQG